jgi:transcriptional regulator with XRE-family HTH domain
MSFRDNLQHLRATRNMTQEQLAMLLGVSRQSVSKWEAERAYPEMDKLIKICELFGCSLDELVKGDLTERGTDATFAVPENATPQDVVGYDEHMRRHAERIASGVALIVFGVAFAALFSGTQVLSGSEPGVLGVICLFIGIGAGLAFIIPAGTDHSAFVRAHPFIEDFYTSEEKAQAHRRSSRAVVSGIALMFCGIVAALLFPDNESLAGFLFLAFTAVGVWSIVRFGMRAQQTDVSCYNNEALDDIDLDDIEDPVMRERARKRKRVGAISGVIMLIATAIGLLLLFIPNPWQGYFWVVWPIGGIICGAVSTAMSYDRD